MTLVKYSPEWFDKLFELHDRDYEKRMKAKAKGSWDDDTVPTDVRQRNLMNEDWK